MSIALCLQPRLTTSLVMTPQLQAAIGLLQLSQPELAVYLRRELDHNPLLEERFCEAEDSPWARGDGAFVGRRGHAGREDEGAEAYSDPRQPASLGEHLQAQLQLMQLSARMRQLTACLVGEIDDDGYLAASAAEDIARHAGVGLATVEAAITLVQELDPAGVGGRSLPECLALQATRLAPWDDLLHRLVLHHLPLVARGSLPQLTRAVGAPASAVEGALARLRRLSPRPGRAVGRAAPPPMIPDLYLRPRAGAWEIGLNEQGQPRFVIQRVYRDAMAQARGATQDYLREKMRAASWLLRSLAMRRRTMLRVMGCIADLQRPFFERGPAHLRPLVLREVAAALQLHESTVSRVTSNKVVQTDDGLFPLRYFFASSLRCGDTASEVVRQQIARIVAQEDPRLPHSDGHIAEILRADNIDIARRTVAKYREVLKISPSSLRRRAF